MRKKFNFIVSILSIVFCLSAIAFGQSQFGSIEVTVKDQNGAVVPNVAVTIKNIGSTTDASGATSTGTGSGFNRTVTTDSDGFVRVMSIPPGIYNVTTSATGFGPAVYNNVAVVIDKATQIEVQVQPGTATATVDVGASDQPLDTTSSDISTSINAQKIELLPKGTDFLSVLKTSPGTRPDPIAGGYTVDGATNSENVFVIDGQEVTNYRNAGINGNNQIPLQLVQEVQVKSSGFDAEFGGATGGVINVVTKGGSNQWRGEFGIQFDTAKFRGENRPTLSRFTAGSGATFTQTVEYYKAPKSDYLNVFPTANLSGPILKDKVWFFGSYTPQVFDTKVKTNFYTNLPAATRTLNSTDTYRNKRTYEYAFGRIDASPIDSLRISATYLWNPIIDEGLAPFGTVSFASDPAVNFGGAIGTLQGSALRDKQGGRQNGNNVTVQGVYTPTGNLVFTGRYSRGFLNEKLGNYFIPTGIQFVCVQGVAAATNPNSCPNGPNSFTGPSNTITRFDVSVRENWEADASYIFNAAGRHELKGGYQHMTIFNDLNKGFTTRIYLDYTGRINESLLAWTSAATPAANAVGAGALYRFGQLGSGSNLNQAIYIQDKWQPFKRLTLNLGIRFEKEDIPSFNGFDAPFSFSWTDKLAPRLGFAYDLSGNGKSKIFGSYGKFYDRLKFRLAQGSFGGDFYRVDFFDILPTDGNWTNYTEAQIRGDFDDRIGGLCPPTGFIGNGRSRCQADYRVASNQPGADIEEAGGVDSDLKPYQQRELTFGYEREFGKSYFFRGRYTNKTLVNAIEDAGAISSQGSEVYITGNPGEGLHAEFLRNFGYAEPYAKPERKYNAMELVLEKRLSNNYYFNMNYTLSRLEGNYSGLANTDEQSGGLNGNARSDPGVNRSFDLPFIGFTALGKPDNGPLASDRTHVFNAYGAYIFDWKGSKTNSTELSVFQTIQSGVPVTTFVNFITATIFTKRGDLGRTPAFTQTDFNITHRYRFGRDNRFTIVGDLNILNLFDEKNVLGYFNTINAVGVNYTTFPQYLSGGFPGLINAYNRGELKAQIDTFLAGTPTVLNRKDGRYNQANSFQGPRQVRFGFRLLF
jgi:hypothetical protein